MNDEIKKGDVVRLREVRSPPMLVAGLGQGVVACWFDQDDRLQTETFPAGSLERLPTSAEQRAKGCARLLQTAAKLARAGNGEEARAIKDACDLIKKGTR